MSYNFDHHPIFEHMQALLNRPNFGIFFGISLQDILRLFIQFGRCLENMGPKTNPIMQQKLQYVMPTIELGLQCILIF